MKRIMPRRHRAESTIITIRTSLPTLHVLDQLTQLESKSRNRIIIKAIHEHALDYVGARGHASSDYLRNRLRLVELLQKRIEMNLDLKGCMNVGNIEQDRRQMLEETCRYARYARNEASLLILSKVAGWLAATFHDPLPEDMKARTSELTSFLGAATETHDIRFQQTTPPSSDGTGCNTPNKSL